MPGMTAEQAKREEKSHEDTQAAPPRESPIEPVPLSVVLGCGRFVTIGERSYEVAPIPIKRLPEVNALLAKCPEALILHAMAAAQDAGNFDVERTLDLLTEVRGVVPPAVDGDASPDSLTTKVRALSQEDVSMALVMSETSVDADDSEAMVQAAMEILRRKHKEITASELEDDLDVPAFLRVICAMYAVNPNLVQRFVQAAPRMTA